MLNLVPPQHAGHVLSPRRQRGFRVYSPQLAEQLISPLYHAAKARGIPMTKLASQLVAEGLGISLTTATPGGAVAVRTVSPALFTPPPASLHLVAESRPPFTMEPCR